MRWEIAMDFQKETLMEKQKPMEIDLEKQMEILMGFLMLKEIVRDSLREKQKAILKQKEISMGFPKDLQKVIQKLTVIG